MPTKVSVTEHVKSTRHNLLRNTDYHALNAMLNLYDVDGKIQFNKDIQAVQEYFLQHVNQNTMYFSNQDERLDFLIKEDYLIPGCFRLTICFVRNS